MGLFSREPCTFCGKEVGMMHRSRLATGEYICTECRYKTNPFARMDCTSRDAAQRMIDTLGQEEARLRRELDRRAAVEREDFDLGGRRIRYSAVTALGVFQLDNSEWSRYEHRPVLYFDRVRPYRLEEDARRPETADRDADCVTVSVSRDPEGRLTSCAVVIPYRDDCIREIRLVADVESEERCSPFYALADRLNRDRRISLERGEDDASRREKTPARGLGDTADGVGFEKAVRGAAAEKGEVRQGLFGGLFKK